MDEGKLDRITLPGEPLTVSEPLGTDTYLMLTTTTPLANPDLLEFTGVVTRSLGSALIKRQFEHPSLCTA
jgi:hypothetical protein